MTAAERIVRWVCRILPAALSDWGEAMAQEAASIARPGAAIAFALGCGVWVLREAMGNALRLAFTPIGTDLAEVATPRPKWSTYEIGLLCAIAATGLGLVHLAESGAPARSLLLNLAALIAGLIIVIPFRRRNPVTEPFVGVVSIVVGIVLILTATIGEETAGARRWLALGDVVVQPSLIGLPFLLVAFARCRDFLTTTGLVLGAIALSLQPDRAMAGAMVTAVGVIALLRRDRAALLTLLVALASFIVTAVQPDIVPAASFADGEFGAPSSNSFLADVAVWGGLAVLLLPVILNLRCNRESVSAYAAFGGTWMSLITAAIFADYPLPVVAYGGSAIVGYVWSILALPGGSSSAKHSTLMVASHSASTIDNDPDRSGRLSRVQGALL